MRVIKTKTGREKVIVTRLELIPLVDHFCEICGTDKNITAHHIRERRNGGTDDLDNLMVLCNQHHKLVHKENDSTVREIYKNLVMIRILQRRNRSLKEKGYGFQ